MNILGLQIIEFDSNEIKLIYSAINNYIDDYGNIPLNKRDLLISLNNLFSRSSSSKHRYLLEKETSIKLLKSIINYQKENAKDETQMLSLNFILLKLYSEFKTFSSRDKNIIKVLKH